jgi:hypothetical protein
MTLLVKNLFLWLKTNTSGSSTNKTVHFMKQTMFTYIQSFLDIKFKIYHIYFPIGHQI